MRGRVLKSTGSWYEVRGDDRKIYPCRLRGLFRKDEKKVTNPIAVGDLVIFEREDDQDKKETGRIVEILPRENYIIRKAIQKGMHSHIIAANIDQALLIATLKFPRTSLGFIDRFLVSAESFRIPAVVVFNKADLLNDEFREAAEELKTIYEPIGYKCLIISAFSDNDIIAFKELLSNKVSLVSGHSGVGKSTLINKVAPNINQKTSEISSFANKGVHTTTFAEIFEIGEDTFIIDTPGIKEFGLVEIEKDELAHYFPEMRDKLGECKYHNCTHTHEPGCAVVEAVEEGEIAISRYENYLSILQDDDNRR